MSGNDKERLLARWSRLKRESAATRGEEATAPEPEVAATAPDRSGKSGNIQDPERATEPMPELPAIDDLNADSDFQPFMDPRVDDDVRRAALKTLFRNPQFNVTDGLDVYAEDYTKLEKLTPAMVAALKYAQRTLFAEPDQPDGQSNQGNDTRTAGAEETIVPENRSAGGSVLATGSEDAPGTDVPDSDLDASAPNQATGNEPVPKEPPSSPLHARANRY